MGSACWFEPLHAHREKSLRIEGFLFITNLKCNCRAYFPERSARHIKPDTLAEFTARRVRRWLANLQIKPLFIETGSPWENGYIESFNGKMRDELLNGEIFYTLKKAQILIEMRKKEYNTIRPHSTLGYRPPAPKTIMVPTTQFQQLALT